MSKAMPNEPARTQRCCFATTVVGAVLGCCWGVSLASETGAGRGSAISVETRAELIVAVGGTSAETVLVPAAHVVAGDVLSFTLEIRNNGTASVQDYSFESAIPEHMIYIADSAVAPGAIVAFSVDGGNTFDEPVNLRVRSPGGELRGARPADYTHIRWTLRNRLNAGSIAFARFRARVVG
jgi:uncharacterized repeat protein (TIGR01451 family)